MAELATMTADQARASWHPGELSAAAGKLDPETAAQAAKGDAAVLPAVDAFLAADPAATALWGDMGRRLLRRWVRRYAGNCLTTERAVLRLAADLRARLAGPRPTALDVLLAERVVIGWVFLSWCEAQYEGLVAEVGIAQQQFHLKRIDLAHRGLLSACRTLAKVKKAKLPDVLALVNVNPPAADGLVPSAGA